jgi:hypothetical protein
MTTTSTADDYHDLRGNSTWVDGDDEDKEQALYRAWDYLRGLNWLDDMFDTELPDDVTRAHIVAAYEELKSPGCLQPIISNNDHLIEKNIAGVIIKKYRPGAPSRKRFLEIESLLKKYVTGLGSSVELRRG